MSDKGIIQIMLVAAWIVAMFANPEIALPFMVALIIVTLFTK